MKLIKSIIGMVAALAATVGYAGDSAPFRLDTRDDNLAHLNLITLTWDASWIGGDASAIVWIEDNGEEIKRATGVGEFEYTATGACKHVLTYKTSVNGVEQDEAYSVELFRSWRYEGDEAGIVLTGVSDCQGSVSVPEMLDGLPVVGIGANVFAGNDRMTEVIIPEGVTNVETGAFAGCNALTSVSLPAGLLARTTIAQMFPDAYTQLESAELTGDGGEIAVSAFNGCVNLTSMTIPANIASIKTSFPGIYSNLESVKVGPGMEIIPSGLLEGCSQVSEVVLPPGLVGIEEGAFAGCDIDNVYFGGTLNEWVAIDVQGRIGDDWQLFCNGKLVRELIVGDDVESIAPFVIDGCSSIMRVSGIRSDMVSLGTLDLRDIEVEGAYESGGFRICNGWVLGYGDDAVNYLEIPEGVVGIAPCALSGLWDLKEVVLPESLKYIGYRAFYDDGYLGNGGDLVIPDSVEVIEDEAFKDCSWLPGIQMGGGVRKIGARAFEGNSSLATLRMPDAVEEIGDNAFLNCNKLRSVKLPALLETIGADPFAGCGALTGVTVPVWHWTMAEMFPSRYSSIANVTLLGGEGEIATNAFKGCSSLASVTIPVDVTNICDGAFMNCSNMTAIELPENLVTVGADAFRGCSRLSAIVLPDSVTSIGANVFYGCGSLANVTLSRSITEIPDYAFYNCGSLTSIVMPEGVATLGNYISSSLRAVYLLCGKAPEYGANVYSSMPSSAKTYVKQGSRGWDGRPSSRVLPESWNGRGIEYWTPVQFDATFDANGGTFELTGETSGATAYACRQTKDTSYALPPFDPVWEGHVFDGWWTERSDGTQITATTRVIEEREITFYAHWIGDPKEVTVRFNANGGTVEPGEGNYYASRPYGQLPVPTREYHRFAGWWTLPHGGSRVVVSTAVPAADQELYAHWTPETYIIRYHANGGIGSMADQAYTYGSTVTLRANRFTGKDIASHFVGWAISPDGSAVYADGKTLSTIAAIEDGVINLYAVWSAVQYAVRFDSNGGYGEMANQTLTIGVEEPLDACTFTRMGFDFIGWAGVPGGDVVWTNCQSVVNLSSIPESTVVLYAVWNLVSPMPAVATDADVAVVMEGAASSLKANISSLSEYNSYRAWAETRVESQETAVSSENGWLSFALDAESVIARELTDGDVSVEKLEPGGNNGEYTLEVAIEDVAVGDNATSERLVKAFGLEGSSELDLAKFSGENVSLEAVEPKDGKVKLTVKPKKNTGTFFMRVKLNK